MAIAFFYATGTIVGGFGGPLLFGALIQSGDPDQIFIGYVVGAVVMIIGGIIQATMGVEAARPRPRGHRPAAVGADEELDEPGEEADPYTLGRGEGRGTSTPAALRPRPPSRRPGRRAVPPPEVTDEPRPTRRSPAPRASTPTRTSGGSAARSR